jgi:hypothetical protein
MVSYIVSWLPDLVKYDSSKMTLDQYIEALYEYFKQDFIYTKPKFNGEELALKKYPLRDNKEATFYHITTKGEDEENRIFEIERCERIRWAKSILESDYIGLKIWENKRKNKKNILIWFDEMEYIVIIRKMPTYKMFWTAYPVTEPHRKIKLQKEYEKYMKAKTAP